MVLSSESDKAKLFAENVSKKAELDDSGTFLHACRSSTNLKLHNISVTSKLGKKVLTNLDSSKASCPDCISVVVLKNLWARTFINTCWTLHYVPEGILFSRLLEFFICGPCIYECWGEVLCLCLVKSLKSVDYLKKRVPFSDSQHGFRPAQLTADPLIVVSDRTASAFNKAGTTWAVTLDILQTFNGV